MRTILIKNLPKLGDTEGVIDGVLPVPKVGVAVVTGTTGLLGLQPTTLNLMAGATSHSIG